MKPDLYTPEKTGTPPNNSLRLSAVEIQLEAALSQIEELQEVVAFLRTSNTVMQQLLIRLADERVSKSRVCDSLPDGEDKKG